MTKQFGLTCLVLFAVALASASFTNVSQAQMPGSWTPYQSVTPEDQADFDKMMAPDMMPGAKFFEPLKVSTQAVAGINYRFYCKWSQATYPMKYGYAIVSFNGDDEPGTAKITFLVPKKKVRRCCFRR